MQKLFRIALFSGRKRRCMALGVTLWLLRQLRDAEAIELQHRSDFLDGLEWKPDGVSRCKYADAEEKCYSCEHACDTFETAIDDLEFAY